MRSSNVSTDVDDMAGEGKIAPSTSFVETNKSVALALRSHESVKITCSAMESKLQIIENVKEKIYEIRFGKTVDLQRLKECIYELSVHEHELALLQQESYKQMEYFLDLEAIGMNYLLPQYASTVLDYGVLPSSVSNNSTTLSTTSTATASASSSHLVSQGSHTNQLDVTKKTRARARSINHQGLRNYEDKEKEKLLKHHNRLGLITTSSLSAVRTTPNITSGNTAASSSSSVSGETSLTVPDSTSLSAFGSLPSANSKFSVDESVGKLLREEVLLLRAELLKLRKLKSLTMQDQKKKAQIENDLKDKQERLLRLTRKNML